jgi:hypothetical protein
MLGLNMGLQYHNP